MQAAIANAGIMDLHGYGRQLIEDKKYNEALSIFQANYGKHNGAWPTHVGLARGYSATGELKKALEHARLALAQAPDDLNRKNLESMIETLSAGKPIAQ